MDGQDAVDFFVSYTSADRPWAEWIAWQLEEAGYSTLIQAWDFRPAANWVLEMDHAAAIARRTLAVLSPAFLESRYTQPEWAAAFREDPTGESGKLLLVRVRDCDPRGLLGSVVWIDVVGKSAEEAAVALISGLERGRAKPTTEPAFPGARGPQAGPALPEAGASLWNVPLSSATFSGRDASLARLEGELPFPGAGKAVAVHGYGGVGKSQLAAQFARARRTRYDAIWWIRAADRATRLEDYARLARVLALPESDDGPTAREQAKTWLERTPRWLLIFDDALDPEALKELLPATYAGHILITSRRHADWRALGAQPLPLDVWDRRESVAFLAARTGAEDPDAAELLARALGDLPLALEQAASYINRQAIDQAEYARRLYARAPELFSQGKPLDYEHTVATTWNLAFEQVSHNEVAAEILNLCAFLAPERIPRELFEDASSRGATDEAIELLLGFALLLAAGESTVNMHELIQQQARGRLSEAERLESAARVVHVLTEHFPADGWRPESWPECARLFAHAIAVAERSEALAAAPDTLALLLSHVSLYRQGEAEFENARELAARALALEERVYGPDHPQVGSTLRTLGNALQQLGRLKEARSALERALSIKRREHGERDPQVAELWSDLSIVLQQLGEHDAAFAANTSGLEATAGPGDPMRAQLLNNRGNLLLELGKPRAACDAFEQALALVTQAVGQDATEVATPLVGLGNALRQLGEFDEARIALERALALFEHAYGTQHPHVATTLGNLGRVLENLGELENAHQHYLRARSIASMVYGPEHPQMALRLAYLAGVERQLGRLDEARASAEEALRITEVAYGPEHPGVADMLVSLGMVLDDLQAYSEALTVFDRATEINERVYGSTHPNVGSVLLNRGITLYKSERKVEARRDLERSLELHKAGESKLNVAVALEWLAPEYAGSGEEDAARAASERALSIYEEIYGPRSRQLAEALARQAAVADTLSDAPRAAELHARSLAILDAADEGATG